MPVRGFRLRVTAGPDAGETLDIEHPSGPVTIGRSVQLDPARDLRCTDRKVSRQHATIELTPRGSFVLTDHHSANKTRHNGHHLEPDVPVELNDGDEVSLGPDTVVRFEIVSAPAEPDMDPDKTKVLPSADPSLERPIRSPPAGDRRQQKRPTPINLTREASTPPKPRPTRPRPPVARAESSIDEGEPSERFGRFAIYKALNRRETDRVDMAVDTRSKTRVALKRFTTRQLSRRAQRRVLDDAEQGRRWQHPGIASVLDAGVQSGTLYVASVFVNGVPLADLQARYGREIEPPFAAYIMRETCAALQYALREVSGFVHRNLTPNTIMVSPDGQVTLINFGFPSVKALLDTTVKLTPAEARYLSPEHLRGRGLDPRSDVFSAGVILYELLIQEPIDVQRKGVLAPVDDVRPQLPPAIAEVTTQAVALRPESRFRTPGEMEEALSAALGTTGAAQQADAAAWMKMRFPDL